MGLIITPESQMGTELRKWEQHPTKLAIDENGDMTPGNPYVFRPYPRDLYRAIKLNGRITVFFYDAQDGETKVHPHCIKVVDSEDKERMARNDGWCDDPQKAYDAFERMEQERGNEAARVEAAAAGMTANARRELAAAHGQTHEHVTDVVGTKKGPRASDARDKD
jgi:hypothetical protein